VNLNGGTLTTGAFLKTSVGAGQSSSVNFNGGTLVAAAASTAFLPAAAGLSGVVQNGGAIVNTNGFDITVAAPLAAGGTGGLTKNGAGILTLNGATSYTGATTVNTGTLRLGTSLGTTSSVTIAAGTSIEISPNQSRVLKTGPVSIASGGKLDLKDNKLVTTTAVGTGVANGGNYTAGSVSRLVQTASNGGAWDGSGITTSMPDATAGLTSIGVAVASDVRDFGVGTTLLFSGQTITPTSTLAMYTYAGDANLDGQITGDDYSGIDFTILDPNNAGGWFNGDFNYDGFVSGDDYSAIDFNILAQGAPFPTSASAGTGLSGVVAVPEPATLSVIGLGAVGLMLRRRRRRR
jgi:autotransporter-associated beta strand protein